MAKNFLLLTFEDGPFRQTTPKLLEVLNSSNTKAVFFVTQRANNLDLIREIFDQGHLLGFQNGSGFFGRRHSELTKQQLEQELTKLKEALGPLGEHQLALVRGAYAVEPTDPEIYKQLNLTFLGADASWSDRPILLEDGPPQLREMLDATALRSLKTGRWLDPAGEEAEIQKCRIIPRSAVPEFPDLRVAGRLALAAATSYWARQIKTPHRLDSRTVLRVRETSRFLPDGLRDMLARCVALGGQFVDPKDIFDDKNGWDLSRVEKPAPMVETLESRSEQGQVSRLWSLATAYLAQRWGVQKLPALETDASVSWGVGTRLPSQLPSGFWDTMKFFRSPTQSSTMAYETPGFLQFLPDGTTLKKAQEAWEKLISGEGADAVLSLRLEGAWALLSWELCDSAQGRLKPLENLRSDSRWSTAFAADAAMWEKLESLLLPDSLKLLWVDLRKARPGEEAAILKIEGDAPPDSCLARLMPQRQKVLDDFFRHLTGEEPTTDVNKVLEKLRSLATVSETTWNTTKDLQEGLRRFYRAPGSEPNNPRQRWFHTLHRLALVEPGEQEIVSDLRHALEAASGDHSTVDDILKILPSLLQDRLSLTPLDAKQPLMTEDALDENDEVTEKFKDAKTIVFFLNGLGGNTPSACAQLQKRLQEFDEKQDPTGPKLACFNGDYDDLRRRRWDRSVGRLKEHVGILKAEILERAQRPKIIIVGHSLGGQASLQTAELLGVAPPVEVELLVPLDPIEAADRVIFAGARASIRVGAHVKRLYHFWTPAENFFWAMNFNSPTPFALTRDAREGMANDDINGFHQGSSLEHARNALGRFLLGLDDSLTEVNHAGGAEGTAIYQEQYLEEILFQTITRIHSGAEAPPDVRPTAAVYWCSRDSSRTLFGNEHFLLIQHPEGNKDFLDRDNKLLFKGMTLSLQDLKQDGQFTWEENFRDDLLAVEESCRTTASSLHLGAPDFDLEIKLVPVTRGTPQQLVSAVLSAKFDSRRFKPDRQGRGFRNYTAAAVEALLALCGVKKRHLEQLRDFRGVDPEATFHEQLFSTTV